MLLGMNYYMCVSGIIRAYFVFKRKTSHIFILVVSGLVVTLVEATVSYLWLYLKTDVEVALGFITLITWQLMIQIPIWIYTLRIQSLVGYDYKIIRYARAAPFVVLLSQIPSGIGFGIAMYNYELWSYFVITSAITTVVACIVEVIMYAFLMNRVKVMFQYRKNIKRQMATELTLSMVLLIAIDIALVGLKLSKFNLAPLSLPSPVVQMDNALRPFSYMLRINIAIQFFDDLLEKVNNRPKTTESYARWFNSNGSGSNE